MLIIYSHSFCPFDGVRAWLRWPGSPSNHIHVHGAFEWYVNEAGWPPSMWTHCMWYMCLGTAHHRTIDAMLVGRVSYNSKTISFSIWWFGFMIMLMVHTNEYFGFSPLSQSSISMFFFCFWLFCLSYANESTVWLDLDDVRRVWRNVPSRWKNET